MTSIMRSLRNARLPDALVVGPQRAGTTWIHRYLASRGDVALPRHMKETYFFDRRFHRGVDWYARRFGAIEPSRRVVEVASTYFHHPDSPSRVRSTLGPVPLVCTLRHPVDRAFSLYRHYVRYGMTRIDFRMAVQSVPDIGESLRYATHLQRWRDVFGDGLVLVLMLDELATDPQRYADRLCRHIQLRSIRLPDEIKRPANESGAARSSLLAGAATVAARAIHGCGASWVIDNARKLGVRDWIYGRDGSGTKDTIAPSDRIWLMDQVRSEIDDLEELLQVDLSSWKYDGTDRFAA